jgi:hypothetical protein
MSIAKKKEKPVEKYLFDKAKRYGGYAFKMNSGLYTGIPDRLVIAPGKLAVVETKRPKNGRLSVEQKRWIRMFNLLVPDSAFVLCSEDEIDDFFEQHVDSPLR